jgi:hypothetical protein
MLLGAGIIIGSVVLITSHQKEKSLPKKDEIPESNTPDGSCKPVSAST